MQDEKYVAASALAVIVTLVGILSLRPLAGRVGLVDKPSERKHHRGRVPVIGGLCFFLGTIAGLSYMEQPEPFIASLLGVGALVLLAGFVDDMEDLTVRARLLIEIGLVSLVVVVTGAYIDGPVDVFGTSLALGVLGIPFTIFAVVGLMNAFNMLDGIDGLAGALALVAIFAIIAFAGGDGRVVGAVTMLQILAAALVPYLCVNLGWPDGRKIFMGDAGSTLVGFLLAFSLVHLSSTGVSRISVVDVPWCIALPVMDTLAVMYRRAQKGISPFTADRQHLHHLLLDAGLSPRVALAVIVAAAAALAVLGYALRDMPDMVSIGVLALAFIAYLLWLDPVLAWVHDVVVARTMPVPVAEAAGAGTLGDPGSKDDDEGARPISSVRVSNPRLEVFRGSSTGADAPMHAPAAHVPVPARGTSEDVFGLPVRALCILGAHPCHVRMVPIVHQLARDSRFEARVCAVAPESIAARLLQVLGVEIDGSLQQASAAGAETERAAATLARIRGVLQEFRPDVVVVHGDTPSTLAAALAAYYERIPLAHVETGSMREHTAANWPNEGHHKIINALASFHLASNEAARRRLVANGAADEATLLTDTARIDSARGMLEAVHRDPLLGQDMAQRFAFLRAGAPLVFVPDAGADAWPAMAPILEALARARPGVDIVCAAPGKDDSLHVGGPAGHLPNLHLLTSLDYLGYAYLLDAARLALAAGHEVQEEAGLLGTPVVVLACAQGRPAAGADWGHVRWAGNGEAEAIACVLALVDDDAAHQALCAACVKVPAAHASLCIIDALSRQRCRASSLAA